MDDNRLARCILTALVLLLGVAASAQEKRAADDPWDPRAWSRYNGWQVTAFSVVGLPSDVSGGLGSGLAMQGRWKLVGGRKRPPFQAATLLEDLRRIRLHLARHGYPASRVRPVLSPVRAKRNLGIRLEVVPGPVARLVAVRFSGWPQDVPQPTVAKPQLLAAGAVFTDDAYDEMQAFLKQYLAERGYARAKISPLLEVQPGAGVVLEVVVESGEHYVIDSVSIRGCADDLQPLARRVLDIREGSAFDGTRLDGAAADLRSTQLFSAVTLTTEPAGPGRMDLTAELADARMRSWRASVGTWNDNPWMVTTGWTHRNLFRRGRGLDIAGTYATHEMRVGAAYFWLGWLSPRARSSVATEWLREDEDAYLSEEYRLELVQSFRPRDRALSNVGVGLSSVDVQTRSPDVTDIPESQDWLLEFWFDRKWDWTNDIMFPTRGGYAKIGLTYAPPGGPFKSSYAKFQVDGAAYQPVGERIILAGRLRLGWSRPLGESGDLLANRRFYAGGYNTMRGFERRGLGPKDSAGSARGGQAVGLAGAETRVRLAGIFDLAFFADSGQVWREPEDFAWSDLELAVGVDLDLRSPLGPVRVGHAWTVTSVSIGTPRTLWHFGIGYPW